MRGLAPLFDRMWSRGARPQCVRVVTKIIGAGAIGERRGGYGDCGRAVGCQNIYSSAQVNIKL